MLTTLKSMIRNEDGASMVEYGLLISLIAVVAMIGVKALGANVSTLYTTVAGTI
ncbi:MAG TPA: Flp family type IVb pilin [Candidatus Cybelea sp.]|nr:Flp family type IVb pilin [Candidatus Cybelea sp.]